MNSSLYTCHIGTYTTTGFINIYSVAKYQKTRKGDSFETLKIFEKSRTIPKKNQKGDPFALISAGRTWPHGLSSFSSFYCKKSGQIRVRL